jgi:myo-inositol-1(or 4)-monophosphatase
MMANYLQTAIEAARTAGAKLREETGKPAAVDKAEAHDIKLALDRECQELITRLVLNRFPDHTVFGEEGGSDYGASEYQWIVDPIDGTVNFFYGFPHYCTTLALQRGGTTIVGVTYDPVRDEMFTATTEDVSRLNGHPIHVSPRTTLSDAMVSTGFAKSKEIVDQSLPFVRNLALNARKVRMNGCAALDMAYVACGRLDAYIERGIRTWDIAAGVLLIERAGGKVELRPVDGKAHAFRMYASSGQFPLDGWQQ